MTITMYDSIDVSQIPADAEAAAGYTGGHWPTFSELQRRFPHAHLLSIAVSSADDAMCLDDEPGDATNDQIYGWFKRQQARKVWRPCIYSSASNIAAILTTMGANGFPRSSFRLWSAHYSYVPHICAPTVCGYPAADATQWTNRALGRNLDQSMCAADFFGAAPKPPPSPDNWTEAMIENLPTLAEGPNTDLTYLVYRLQGELRGVGKHLNLSAAGDLSIDGSFGPLTTAAVKAVQKHYALTVDGIVGRSTWGYLVTG